MLVKILMENTTVDPALHAEHGLSIYIESKGHKLLVDTGQSDLTWENAKAMGVDIREAEYLILSHGHYDHSGGLMGFVSENQKAPIYIRATAFGDFRHGSRYIGMDSRVASLPGIRRVYGNSLLTADISLLTHFTERELWPFANDELTVRKSSGEEVPDTFDHEHALVVRENGRFALFSGCAHSGIVNITDKFRQVYGLAPHAVFSGFHLIRKQAYTERETELVRQTAERLKRSFPETVFYTGHCTGEPAFDLMKPIMGEQLKRMSTGKTFRLFEQDQRFRPESLEAFAAEASIE